MVLFKVQVSRGTRVCSCLARPLRLPLRSATYKTWKCPCQLQNSGNRFHFRVICEIQCNRDQLKGETGRLTPWKRGERSNGKGPPLASS